MDNTEHQIHRRRRGWPRREGIQCIDVWNFPTESRAAWILAFILIESFTFTMVGEEEDYLKKIHFCMSKIKWVCILRLNHVAEYKTSKDQFRCAWRQMCRIRILIKDNQGILPKGKVDYIYYIIFSNTLIFGIYNLWKYSELRLLCDLIDEI